MIYAIGAALLAGLGIVARLIARGAEDIHDIEMGIFEERWLQQCERPTITRGGK